MADGLYKTLSMAPEPKRLLRHAEREADRGDKTQADANSMVIANARRKFSPRFLRKFCGLAEESASVLPGLDLPARIRNSRDLGGQGMGLEEDSLRRLKRLHREGHRGPALAISAIGEALDHQHSNEIRQIEQHCLVKRGERARPIIDAVKDAGDRVDCYAIAEKFVRGERIQIKTPRIKIELDENLLRP